MTWTVVYTEQYTRRAARLLKRHPEMATVYQKTLALLATNPHHPSLRLHALKGRLSGLHSVSITMRYRVTIEMIIFEKEVIPINVGDHDEVY